FFFSSRRRHTRSKRDWSSDVCSSDLLALVPAAGGGEGGEGGISLLVALVGLNQLEDRLQELADVLPEGNEVVQEGGDHVDVHMNSSKSVTAPPLSRDLQWFNATCVTFSDNGTANTYVKSR